MLVGERELIGRLKVRIELQIKAPCLHLGQHQIQTLQKILSNLRLKAVASAEVNPQLGGTLDYLEHRVSH